LSEAPTARTRPLGTLAAGERSELTFTITQQDLRTFMDLSGDRNPLHEDADFAHQRGFRAPVVHGALLLSRLSRLIGMELPGAGALWTGLEVAFRNPVHVGDRVTLAAELDHVSEATGILKMAFSFTVGGKLVANGKAEIMARG